jgi:hypothetical protein
MARTSAPAMAQAAGDFRLGPLSRTEAKESRRNITALLLRGEAVAQKPR